MRDQSDGPHEAVPAQGFSVREYARTAVGSHRGTMDLSPFADNPLRPDTLRALRYLAVVESGTMGHLRNVLVTATHKDARVTAFLGTWAFEKFWIADALAQVVDAHPLIELPVPARPSRVGSFFGELRERARPITGSIRANRLGEAMIAVHMTVGTIDEWVTQAAFGRVAEQSGSPALTGILDALVAVKARQLEFFEAQARDRLASHEATRAVVARQLRSARWPVGAEAAAASETEFFYSSLFGPAPATVEAIDSRISTLPGQEGLTLMTRAVAAHRGARS